MQNMPLGYIAFRKTEPLEAARDEARERQGNALNMFKFPFDHSLQNFENKWRFAITVSVI